MRAQTPQTKVLLLLPYCTSGPEMALAMAGSRAKDLHNSHCSQRSASTAELKRSSGAGASKPSRSSSNLEITLEGIDMIFPFSENWPANYNFSLFSKLPTNYPKNQKIFKKQSKIRGDPRIFGKNRLLFEYF